MCFARICYTILLIAAPFCNNVVAMELEDVSSKPASAVKPFSLMYCSDMPLPLPTQDKNIIILFICNHYDGVGDFMHGLSFAEEIKSLVQSQYLICAYVSTTTSKHQEDVRKRADFVKHKLMSGRHCFDKWYLNESDYGAAADNKKWLSLSSEKLTQLDKLDTTSVTAELKRAAMALEISTEFGLKQELAHFLPNSVRVVYCGEYGHPRPSDTNCNYSMVLRDATMGLLEQGAVATYGIKLHHTKTERLGTCSSKLLAGAGSQGTAFVEHLFKKKEPGEKDVERYFREHAFMPAYLQSTKAATAFIVTHVLSQLNEKHELQKKCDFLIPKNIVDQEQIRVALAKYDLQAHVVFVTQNSRLDDHSSYSIRVMSFFIDDDDDYRELYEIAQATGCSGDNSVSLSFSSTALPFFEYKGSVFGEFLKRQLKATIMSEVNSCDDADRKEALRCLKDYFSLLCVCYDDVSSVEGNFFIWCESVSTHLTSPLLRDGWKCFRSCLFEKYNYNANFLALLKTILYLAHDDIHVQSLFKDADRVRAIERHGFYPDAAGLRSEDFIWLTMAASETLLQGITRGFVDSQFICDEFTKRLPIVNYDWAQFLNDYSQLIEKLIAMDSQLAMADCRRAFLIMRRVFTEVTNLDHLVADLLASCGDAESLNAFIDAQKELIKAALDFAVKQDRITESEKHSLSRQIFPSSQTNGDNLR